MTRLTFVFMIALYSVAPAVAEDTFTSPQAFVNVTIEPSHNGKDMIFTGVHLYFEMTQSAYHVEAQRDRPDLANRTQEVTLLQSKLVRFGVHQLKFRTVAGEDVDAEDVPARLKKNPLVLMLPNGAKIHPQLATALAPEALIVSRADRKPTFLHLVPRPDGG